MKIARIFNKIFGKKQDSSPKKEEITFHEARVWIENKEKEIKNKENEIFSEFKKIINQFVNELDEKIIFLGDINVESKREEERVKSIVRGNLKSYIHQVKNLKENLNKLNDISLDKLIGSINKILVDFHQKSHINYQKAAFLAGDKMANTKNAINNFSKSLAEILDEDKELIDSSRTISLIKEKLGHLDENEGIVAEIDEKISSISGKIKENKKNEKIISEKIEKIKKSKEYVENQKREEEVKQNLIILEKEIHQLKTIIDFKALGNAFHADRKKMDMIKDYRENFEDSFQKDYGTTIINLLKEVGMNTSIIIAKAQQIKREREEIEKIEKKEDETKELMVKREKLNLEIKNLDEEKSTLLKKDERTKANKEELTNSIKEKFEKIGVIVI
jgi:hypothetical protein